MPQPNGYRKALRFMRHADKFGFPIITFVDTPGAYAGKNAEELGQVHRGPVDLAECMSTVCGPCAASSERWLNKRGATCTCRRCAPGNQGIEQTTVCCNRVRRSR